MRHLYLLALCACTSMTDTADPTQPDPTAQSYYDAAECGREVPCTVENGEFFVFLPDGPGPHPTVFVVHAWNRDASWYFNPAVVEAFVERGYAMVLPQGLNQTWAVENTWDTSRDDLAFLLDVAERSKQLFPLDADRFHSHGFSVGASMVWDLMCHGSDPFTSHAPLSGSFWTPIERTCESPPVVIRHTHGLDDTTMPLEGREFGGGSGQANVYDGVDFWREHNQCSDQVSEVVQGIETCQVWSDCADGAEVWFCLHDGRHLMRSGWVGRMLDWFDAQAP